MRYDVIIIGAGVAGLHTALQLPKSLKTLVISKDYAWECNTFYAQGGVAVANSKEDIALHVKDTLEAGAGHCDEEAVNILCQEGTGAVEGLIRHGFSFDRDDSGRLLYTKEAAHSSNRVVHAGGDATGRQLHLYLMKHLHVNLLYSTQVTDLLMNEDVCHGVRVRHKGRIFNIYASHVVIASGGVGSLYAYHTNARTISADLQGIAIGHGLALKDMEMMQFHPTVFIKSKGVRKQLLSEALRGEGAKVVDYDGYRFLFDYDKDGELAPRNIVSQSIFDYHLKTGKQAFLDVSFLEKEAFAARFPSIYFNMNDEGYDLPKDLIPISPAFHYAMGGIETDLNGKVKDMQNLYAVGEVACTGVHGANRLASNSLLEGLVFSTRVAQHIVGNEKIIKQKDYLEQEILLVAEGDKALKNELRTLMWKSAGIVREKKVLANALQRVEDMLKLRTGKLLKLRLETSKAIIRSALARQASLGAHYILEEREERV